MIATDRPITSTAERLGYVEGLLRQVLVAAEMPSDVRHQCVDFAIKRARLDYADGGRLAR